MHTSSADHTLPAFSLWNAIAKQVRARACIWAPRTNARLNVSLLACGCATWLADAPLLALAHDVLPVKHDPWECAQLGRSGSYSWAERPDLWGKKMQPKSVLRLHQRLAGLPHHICGTWIPLPRNTSAVSHLRCQATMDIQSSIHYDAQGKSYKQRNRRFFPFYASCFYTVSAAPPFRC